MKASDIGKKAHGIKAPETPAPAAPAPAAPATAAPATAAPATAAPAPAAPAPAAKVKPVAQVDERGVRFYITKDGKQHQVSFATPEEAIKAADSRTDGPRQAFTLTVPNGQTIHVVAMNPWAAKDAYFTDVLKGECTTIGVKTRAAGQPRALTLDAVLAAINALPPDARAKALEAMKGV
jgi:hypothetical protein